MIPLKSEAILALNIYLGWLEAASQPNPITMFVSISNNNRDRRLGYSGIYDLIKALAEAA